MPGQATGKATVDMNRIERAAPRGARTSQTSLAGRTALVTGASEGIGAAIALAFARCGASLVLVARTASKLEALAQRARAEGATRVQCAPADVTDSRAIRALIGGLEGLDIAVNNAGTNSPGPFVDLTDAELDAMLELNVRAYFVIAQAAVQRMLADGPRRGDACVINVTSQMGHVGAPQRAAYCMTKHAIEGLTKAMAVELAPQRVRVNSIGPTFIDTPLIRRIVDTPDKQRQMVSKIPLGRLGHVDDVAGAAVYLASPAAAMTTGVCVRVDGGWTAQ
ncbi:SDR family NAD(P)-dependent oxidoreductase [Paraburkholderia caballeronis]|uniref:SDR family NAD(P)-dependent oxidoreductase n=1 Tax=Paraburkholderia caballeronis TaxID=416943 RepID=UPI001FB9E3B5|nr:SDR family oxidoreductase [Paraburkholderia caballeronis]